jgi:hypothetical protein
MTCMKLAKILMTQKLENKAESLVNNNPKMFNFSKKLLYGICCECYKQETSSPVNAN